MRCRSRAWRTTEHPSRMQRIIFPFPKAPRRGDRIIRLHYITRIGSVRLHSKTNQYFPVASLAAAPATPAGSRAAGVGTGARWHTKLSAVHGCWHPRALLPGQHGSPGCWGGRGAQLLPHTTHA